MPRNVFDREQRLKFLKEDLLLSLFLHVLKKYSKLNKRFPKDSKGTKHVAEYFFLDRTENILEWSKSIRKQKLPQMIQKKLLMNQKMPLGSN